MYKAKIIEREMYAKILIGELKGKTLFVKTVYSDGLILVRYGGNDYDFIPEEYTEINMK